MKILHVFDFFSPHGGGTVDVVYKLSQALAKRRHEVTIYTSDFKLDREYINSLPEVNVRPFRCISSLAGFYLIPGTVMETKRHLRDFDVIHLHSARSFQNIVIHHYAKKYGIPYVVQAHGSLPNIIAKQRLKQVYDNLWGCRLLKDASRVIAVTRTEAEQYKSMGVSEDKIEIVPNGIDLSEFDNLPEGGEFRRKYGLDSKQRIILYLGRIHKIKGLDLLAQAFADLSKSLDNIKLVIIGPDDGYLSSLKKLIADLEISDKVLFTAPLYGHEKLKAYVDADVYVLPSIYEVFGITVLEACACGVPVVLTDCCGIAAVVDGQAGLAASSSTEGFYIAIQRLLSDPGLCQEFSKNGKSLVRNNFDWEILTTKVERLYEDTIQARS